jgi:hypothetical protein
MTRTDINNNKEGSTSSVNAASNTASKFVIRDIVLKKKNPQQKLEKYFEVKKKTRTNQAIRRNFQGFPLSECCYEEEIGDFVYCPPCYNNNKKRKEGGAEERLCHECLLRPCIVRGKWNHIMDFCEEVMVFENDDSEAMYFKMMNHAESILVEIFGAEYVTKQERAPGCLYELVGNYHRMKGGMEGEEELQDVDPDEDLVANSVDGEEYRRSF